VSNERQRLEQEALQQLNRGSVDGALRAYISILRLDPKDRRIRQKVGEIYLRQGKAQDAERHLREVADALLKEGSHRAAVAVLKQLVSIRPEDPQLQLDLGDCYLAGSYQQDARAAFDSAQRGWMSLGKPLLAAVAARRLVDTNPADLTLRLRVAELRESGNDAAGAVAAYQEVIEEFRRRGRLDEVGRIAEAALKSAPEDVGLLLDAATARVQQGEFKRALQALQTAFMAAPKEPRTLDLLVQAFEGVGQPDRALKVLIELANVAADRAEYGDEANALRRARRLAPDDEDLAARLRAAEDRIGRLDRRLTQLACVAPHDETTLRVVVRAETLVRFGMLERAESEVKAALDAGTDPLPLRAMMAEILVAAKRLDEAMSWMEHIVPQAGEERGAVLDRMALLRGVPAPAEEVAPDRKAPGSSPTGPRDDDEFIDDPLTEPPATVGPAESADQRGDRLAAAGDPAGALAAWREVLAEDLLNEAVLGKIAALRMAARAGEPPRGPEAPGPVAADAFATPMDGTFAEIEPDELEQDDDEVTSTLDQARALVAVGRGDAALALVRDLPGLAARVVHAQAHRANDDLAAALDVMREATNDASDADPAYPEALYELAGLYTATQKHRSALRLLEELRDLAPHHRPGDVEARIRGLQMLSR
jgi:tetratricopeptide (TPR) repeat protein